MINSLEQFSFLFNQDGGYLRIPIWGHIPLCLGARKIIEHPDFVRLAKIRQLGLVHYVFPGATHTRFEHSIGTYHLSVSMLQRLVMNPSNWHDFSPGITPEEARIFLAASLLHDIGHYPYAHIVDRLTSEDTGERFFDSHENRAKSYILDDRSSGSIFSILKETWKIDDPECVADVIANPSDSGLPGRMLSGMLDPDKMDYLMRDAAACGVPYGNIDTDRLIESFVLDNFYANKRLAITEKGIAPLESLVFAKYMMFRHIYWHHAARIAFAMLTRFVQDGLSCGMIEPDHFYSLSDDTLIEHLAQKSQDVSSGKLISDIRDRRLYKRGLILHHGHTAGEDDFTLSGSELESVKELYRNPALRRSKEIEICSLISQEDKIELAGYEVLIDIPRIDSVFDLEDFSGLRVLVTPQSGESQKYVSFNSHGFSQLTAEFAQEFERFSRRVLIVCRPDLKEAVIRYSKEIKSIVSA